MPSILITDPAEKRRAKLAQLSNQARHLSFNGIPMFGVVGSIMPGDEGETCWLVQYSERTPPPFVEVQSYRSFRSSSREPNGR